MRKKGFWKWLTAAALLGALSVGMTAYAEEADAAQSAAVSKKLVQETEYYYQTDGVLVLGTTGVYSYDEQGNLVKYTPYDSTGALQWGAKDHIYDEQGNRIARISYGEPDVIDEWDEYRYDEQGNCILQAKHTSDGSYLWWDEYVYDGQGNCIEMISHEDAGIFQRVAYGYDNKGNLTSEGFYDSDNVLNCLNEYVLDDQGNHIRDLYYNYFDGVKTLVTHAEYTFDDQGKEISRVQYAVDENYIAANGAVVESTVHSYDEQGNKVKTTTTYFEDYDNIHETYYDSQGNETRIAIYSHDGVLESLQDNSYDDEGNCIKRVFYDVYGTGIPTVSYWTDSIYQ